MLYVVFGVFNQPFVLPVLLVAYWVLDLLLGLYRHIVPVLSTCFLVVLILVPDSQYTSLVLASYQDFVLAKSTKILSYQQDKNDYNTKKITVRTVFNRKRQSNEVLIDQQKCCQKQSTSTGKIDWPGNKRSNEDDPIRWKSGKSCPKTTMRCLFEFRLSRYQKAIAVMIFDL
jgi:hypothetical protein